MNDIEYQLTHSKPIDLVVHVGAHLGEELEFYESIGASKILWIEADPDLFVRLKTNLSKSTSEKTFNIAHLALVSSTSNKVLNLKRYSNDGASNSVYSPTKEFKRLWPFLYEVGENLSLTAQTLIEILNEYDIDVKSFSSSLLVLDTQGHELDVLIGATPELVQKFKYICVEISLVPVYDGGADGYEVLNWLYKNGFEAITSTTPHPSNHGDVLLKRKQAQILDKIDA